MEILHTNITMETHPQVSKARFLYDLQGSGTQSATDLGPVNVACKWKHVTSLSEVVYCTRSSDTSSDTSPVKRLPNGCRGLLRHLVKFASTIATLNQANF